MMPILMDPHNSDKQLPKNLKEYTQWIRACLHSDRSRKNKICYMTIHESFVEKGKTQRRHSLHIELSGKGIGGDASWEYGWWWILAERLNV